jgi:hypothetical protein
MYEIKEIYKKERNGVNKREVLILKEIMVINKILRKKKNYVK